MGVKIRTMWMTPFYLFFGVLVIYIFQSQINLNKLKALLQFYNFIYFFSFCMHMFQLLKQLRELIILEKEAEKLNCFIKTRASNWKNSLC